VFNKNVIILQRFSDTGKMAAGKRTFFSRKSTKKILYWKNKNQLFNKKK